MTNANAWDLAINTIGLMGIAALAVPALYANRYGRLLYRISRLQPASAALRRKRADLEGELKRLRDGWSFRNSLCLIVGTALAALSYAAAIIKALIL